MKILDFLLHWVVTYRILKFFEFQIVLIRAQKDLFLILTAGGDWEDPKILENHTHEPESRESSKNIAQCYLCPRYLMDRVTS